MNGTTNQPQNTAPQQAPQPQPQAPQGWAPPPPQPAPVPQRDSRAKSPALACILSAVPGLGQIYVGYYARGFVNAVVVASLFTILVSVRDEMLIPLFLIFMIFFWLYNIIDAGRRAALYNEALAGNRSVDLPQDLELVSLRGSIAGGILFIFGGSILLAHTLFGLSLDWLAHWWPVIGIGFGFYLLFKGLADRSERSGRTAEDDR